MRMAEAGFLEMLKQKTRETDEAVCAFLPEETGHQNIMFEACAYSVKNGGKRLRPMLLLEAYRLCRGKEGEALTEAEKKVLYPFMAALEMIHSSSLVHDDLPCMDNDLLRRGKPSTWARFGEDMGTLCGDGLMIYAFETGAKSTAAAERKLKALEILAVKTGIYGMIGGQTVDVALSGKAPTEEQLRFIYEKKTGALLEAALMIGAVLAGADETVLKKLEQAARAVGMAFQIQDDILDVTATEEELGKPVGSDDKNTKVTWLSLYGLSASKADVARYTKEAISLLDEVGTNDFLKELLLSLVERKS